MSYIHFKYDKSKFTLVEKKSTYQNAIVYCKSLNSNILNLKDVDIERFSKFYNEAVEKSSRRVFRVKSLTEKLNVEQCFGLINGKLTKEDLRDQIIEVCSSDSTFYENYSTVCHAELPTTTIVNLSTVEPQRNDTSSGKIIGIVGGSLGGVLLVVLIVAFILWKKKRSSTAKGERVSKKNKKILKLRYRKVRRLYNFS